MYGGGGGGGEGSGSAADPKSGGVRRGSRGRKRQDLLDDDNPIQEMSLYEGQSLNNPSKSVKCSTGCVVMVLTSVNYT